MFLQIAIPWSDTVISTHNASFYQAQRGNSYLGVTVKQAQRGNSNLGVTVKPVHRCGGWAPRPVFLCSGAKAEVAVETTAAATITSAATVAATT